MVFCPQSPPPSPAPSHPYPSPRSKSPPSAAHFRAARKLPILKYPLTDVTNYTLAQATLELSNLAPILASDERSVQTRGDAPPRRGRGKNRRGRPRCVRAREVDGSMSGEAVIRSPIPFAASSPRSSFHPAFDFRVARRKAAPGSPMLSNASSQKFPYNTTNAQLKTPRCRFSSKSAVTPESPKHGYKRTKRLSSTSPRGNHVSPPSPPSPTPVPRRTPRLRRHLPNTLRTPHQVPPPLPLCFPIPPPSAAAPAHSSPLSNLGKQLPLLPAMNLGSGIAQGVRKKRTKRDLAEVQWQITMHKGLAWRTTREHLNAQKQNLCDQCTRANDDPSRGAMDFAQGGLKIAFERPACTCASGYELKSSSKDSQLHWTDTLDRELVKRLWVKLIAQGCRTIPTAASGPQEAPTPFPAIENSHRGVPFPSGQSEPALAPAIQLSSTWRPSSDPHMDPGIPPRRRVSAIMSSSKARPHASPPIIQISSPKPCSTAAVSMPPSSAFTADRSRPDSQCQMTRVLAPIPRGTLSSAQLTAQAILRHEDARSKPMRRGRPPGIIPRGSSLRHEVTAEHGD